MRALILPAGSVKRFIYLTLVAVLAGLLSSYFLDSPRYWLVWSAVSLSLITFSKTLLRRFVVMILTGSMLLFVIAMARIAALNPWSLAGYLCLLMTINFYLTQRCRDFFYPIFIISLSAIMISAQMVFTGKIMDSWLFMTINIAIFFGMLIAAAAQIIFIFQYKKEQMRAKIMMVLRDLRQLNEDIFACFLDPAYPSNVYLYERRLHVQKNHVTQSLLVLEGRFKCYKKKYNEERQNLIQTLINKLNITYQMLLDGALLRARVSDHTIFLVCKNELQEMAAQLSDTYLEMMDMVNHKKYHVNLIKLEAKIQQFEDAYQSVLQVTAKEPLVFLFFIQSLKSLYAEIVGIYDCILKLKYTSVA